MYEYLGLQDLFQTLLVNKIKVGYNSVFIWEIIERDRKTLLAKKIYRIEQRKTYAITQT